MNYIVILFGAATLVAGIIILINPHDIVVCVLSGKD